MDRDPESMTLEQAEEFYSRFLAAIASLATSTERSLARRLASAILELHAFHEEEFPPDLRPKFALMMRLVDEARLPEGAENHPNYARRERVSYVHPAKAREIAKIIVEIFGEIVSTFRWAKEDEHQAPARQPTADDLASVTVEDLELLKARRLTNAERLAEIKRLEEELAVADMPIDGSKVEGAEDKNQAPARRPSADELAMVTVEDLAWLEAWKQQKR